MAWPPPVLAVNRANTTPSFDTHPNDHNALAQAVNDIVTRVNPSAWTAIPLATGWSNYGSGFNVAQYRTIGDRVELRGLIARSPNTMGGFQIWALPANLRPPGRLMFYVPCNGGHVRVDADPANNLLYTVAGVPAAGTDIGLVALQTLTWSVTT